MNIIMMKLANKKEEQIAFFSLFLKIIFKTLGCTTNRTIESLYTMNKVIKYYENEKKSKRINVDNS